MTKTLVTVVACLVLVGNLCAQDDAAAKRKAAQEKRAKMAEEQFKKMDKDGDGTLTVEEMKWPKMKPEQIERAEQRFKMMDKDGDGKVCCEEFAAAQKKPARKPGKKGAGRKGKKKE